MACRWVEKSASSTLFIMLFCMFCTMLLNYIHILYTGKVIQCLMTYEDHLDPNQKGFLKKNYRRCISSFDIATCFWTLVLLIEWLSWYIFWWLRKPSGQIISIKQINKNLRICKRQNTHKFILVYCKTYKNGLLSTISWQCYYLLAYKRQKFNQNVRDIKETATCYFLSNNSVFSNIFPASLYASYCLIPQNDKWAKSTSYFLICLLGEAHRLVWTIRS